MQCPGCDHEDAEGAFGEPAKCPACGVYYHKALAHKERQARRELEVELVPEITGPGLGEKLKRGFGGVIKAVEDGRRARDAKPAPVKAAYTPPATVAVVDLQMPFWSMVWFMVKWVIASIPALIILALILGGLFSFVVGFTSSFAKYSGL